MDGPGISPWDLRPQREGDIIRMPWAAYDGEWIRLRQRKTGKLIDIPVLTQLRAALEAVPRRGTIMLTTETGRPYKEDWLRHRFARAIEKAGLTRLQFLRRTGVMRVGDTKFAGAALSSANASPRRHTEIITLAEVLISGR